MTKISSTWIVYYKRLFPMVWFGGLLGFAVVAIGSGELRTGQWMFLVLPCVMAVFGFFLFKTLLWDLVDEVHDGGDYLLVKHKGEEQRIPLSNIMNVSASTHSNPPRITLRLVKAGKFGSEVSFSPPTRFSFNLFAKHPIAEDLMVRVDRARSKRAG